MLRSAASRMEFSEETKKALEEISMSRQDLAQRTKIHINDDIEERNENNIILKEDNEIEDGDELMLSSGIIHIEDEDDIQHITIGNYNFHLKIPEAEWNSEKKTLFATMIWNGAKILGKYLITFAKDKIKDKTILELGAGVGVPSFICHAIGAKYVCISDYPTEHILNVIQENIDANPQYKSTNHDIGVAGYKWGTPIDVLLQKNNQQLYEMIIASECLWRHEQHDELLFSISSLLSSTGTAILAFSHHVPGKEQDDLAFFTLATTKYNLIVRNITIEKSPHMWTKKIVNIFIYELQKAPSPSEVTTWSEEALEAKEVVKNGTRYAILVVI